MRSTGWRASVAIIDHGRIVTAGTTRDVKPSTGHQVVGLRRWSSPSPLLISTAGALWLAARIYAAGVLLNGGRPGLRGVVRLVRVGMWTGSGSPQRDRASQWT